jgi:hypothetical protein
MVIVVGFATAKMWISLLFCWSTERELNPRILVLQTSALATSPSVLPAAARTHRARRHNLFVNAYFGCEAVRRYGFTVL